MSQSPISIIIPTLNEADNISLLFERLHTTLHAAQIPFEIIVVDDHSSDATVALTRSAASKYHAKAILKQGKAGKAFSLLEGFDAAKYDLVCMIDADLQYPPEAIAQMYHKMQYCNADVVITNRIDNKTSRLRKLSTGAFHLVFTRFLFGIDYDTQSGLKLFKKRVLQNMTIAPSAWTFDLEFIVRALENNNTILSEDIAFAERNAGVAKINLLSAAFEGAWQSLKLWRTTSVKRVKLNYQYLKPLQQSFNWLLAIVIGTLIGFSATTHQASAASNTPVKDSVKKLTQVVAPITQPILGTLQPPTTAGGSSTTTPTRTPTTLTTTPMQSPSSTPTGATPTAATTNNTPSISVPTATTAAKATASSDPTTLTTQSGKNAPYYPQSKLSSSKTNALLKISLLALEIGGASLAVGLLIFGARSMARKMQRSQSRPQTTFNV